MLTLKEIENIGNIDIFKDYYPNECGAGTSRSPHNNNFTIYAAKARNGRDYSIYHRCSNHIDKDMIKLSEKEIFTIKCIYKI